MITNEALLFLDEPTSGLDSNTALQLGKLLRQLSDSGRTVICTLHQPSSSLFHLFDNVRGNINNNTVQLVINNI